MDWATVGGLLLAATGIISAQWLEGGAIGSLVQPAPFAIVVVGTIGAVLLQSKAKHFKRGILMLRWIFVPPVEDRHTLERDITMWMYTVRREGVLSLERHIDATQDPFIAKGLEMIMEGIDPIKLREILEIEISAIEAAEHSAIKIWSSAGGYAPTIGILGAVLGLIHVMENLSDPSRLGGGIAVAFVATIYGVGLANLILLPIANKLRDILAMRVHRLELLADVFSDLAAGDQTRVIQERVIHFMNQDA